MTDFPPIQQRLMDFIRHQFRPGYNHYSVRKLIGDASARQYYRYVTDTGTSFILAAYPEPFEAAHFPYRQVYELFREAGLPVPQIEALDGRLGIVLQQDLGDDSLQKRLLNATWQQRRDLLRRAIEHIMTIQLQGTPALKPEYDASRLAFDTEKLNWELNFFKRHYVENYRKLKLVAEEQLLLEFGRLAAELAASTRLLCHRDYHVRNLMIQNETLYIIDFQDARWGPLSYDLVSLLKDSIELEPEEVDDHIDFYLAATSPQLGPGFPMSRAEFVRQFQLMSVQRLLKALGTYGYQIVVRGNFIYEQYIAGSLHRAVLSLHTLPEFPRIRALVESELKR